MRSKSKPRALRGVSFFYLTDTPGRVTVLGMQVFSFFDPEQPHPLTRLWIKSWAACGWVPRLILPSETETGLSVRQAANRHGGGLVTTMQEINFSRRPRTKHPVKRTFGDARWDIADTVIFPAEATEDDVLHCGRLLHANRPKN